MREEAVSDDLFVTPGVLNVPSRSTSPYNTTTSPTTTTSSTPSVHSQSKTTGTAPKSYSTQSENTTTATTPATDGSTEKKAPPKRRKKKSKGIENWKDWFKVPMFYQVGVIYMVTRVALNMSQVSGK